MTNSDTIAKLEELLKKRGEHLRQHSPTTKWMNGLDRIDEAILTNLPAILEELKAAWIENDLLLRNTLQQDDCDINYWKHISGERDSLKQQLSEARVANERLKREELFARKLIWLRHGCPISALYGDDGEMQCGLCLLDFKRNSFLGMMERFRAINVKAAGLTGGEGNG